MKIVIGSRGSKLALAQSEEVKAALHNVDPTLDIEIEVISTKGDQILDRPLKQIGDKGLFTQEIEERLIDETIDLAVHSMKDMPSDLPEELMFCGTIKANDYRDCLVFKSGYTSIDDLPQGARVATGSLRRKYQLLKIRPDLQIEDIRGNIHTRLEKLESENFDAIVLACAGLKRVHLGKRIGYIFETNEMIPACAQGILALEVKKNSKLLPFISKIVDEQTTRRMKLERLFMETIESGCHSPMGAHVKFIDERIQFDAIYGDEQGDNLVTYHGIISDDYENKIKEIALTMKEKVG